MATKPASSEKSKPLLPSVSEDKLVHNLTPSRDSKPKSSSKRTVRVNSDLVAVPSEERGRKVPGKREDVGEQGKETLLSSNRKRMTRRGSLQTGLSNCTDSRTEASKEVTLKTRRTSKKKMQVVKPPSPDFIDLSNEKAVQELMLRLYETLRLTETKPHESASVEQKDWEINKSKDNETCLHCDLETTMRFNRQNVIKFPQLSNSTSNLEVFYSKPVSWQCLKNRQEQRCKRSTNYYAFRENFTKSYQDMYNRGQLNQMSWNCRDYTPISTSRPILSHRGFSVPLLMRHSNAFVFPRLLKTSHESRKSVTFAV